MAHSLDLRGVEPPFDYLSAHLLLCQLAPGAHVELLLDDGDAIVEVPQELASDGHEVLSANRAGGHWVVNLRGCSAATVG